MQTSISTLTLEFNIPCLPQEVKQFRGVIAGLGGWDNDLFHQHDNSNGEGKLLQRYPLIQYRSYKGRPYIYAINQGRDALMALWKSGAIEKYYKGRNIDNLLHRRMTCAKFFGDRFHVVYGNRERQYLFIGCLAVEQCVDPDEPPAFIEQRPSYHSWTD